MRAGAYQVPRPETYVRDLGTPKRRGCQNSILDARSLRRGLHPPHLHPRYEAEAGRSRTNDGQLHGASDVSRKRMRNTGEKAKASSPVLFGSIGIIPRVGHGVGQAVDPHFDPHLFQRFCNKKHRKPKFSMLFGAGGVTRTHDLLITKCIGVLRLTVFRDFGAFPLGILREVRPILSIVFVRSFPRVGLGVGQTDTSASKKPRMGFAVIFRLAVSLS